MCLLNRGDNSELKTKQSVQIADACKAEGTTAVFWQKKKFAASNEDIFHFTHHHVTHVRTAVKTKNSAFPESYVFHIRAMSANLVEMLYLRIYCVVLINFDIIFSDFYLMLDLDLDWVN